MKSFIPYFSLLLILASCGKQTGNKNDTQKPGNMHSELTIPTFGNDLEILNDHHQHILLKSTDGKALVAVSPDWQGRVMTSTFNGMEGLSMGWINHNLIKSKNLMPHMNPYGGEDRFWLGPEGGQFSIFFKPGSDFEYENWQVPAEIDTEPFEIVEKSEMSARFKKQMELLNYSGQAFSLLVEREINLLDAIYISTILNVEPDDLDLDFVGYESVNKLTNTGDMPWTKETGTLSIWILGMFQPSEKTTIIIPFLDGDVSFTGKKVNDTYFGKIPPDRLIVKDKVLFYKGDGKSRGKLGIGPERALPFMGAYNPETNVLTIVNYTLPLHITDYVNSMWEIQENPFSGDVVNSYNDGPVADGTQLGPFFELESSSPAAFLKPGECLLHRHRTFHLSGDIRKLDNICMKIFGVTLSGVTGAFH